MAEEDTGIRIEFVPPGSSAEGHLQAGDIITHVEGHQVANDGTIKVEELRLKFDYLVDRFQLGESLRLTVQRDHKSTEVLIPLKIAPTERMMERIYDRLPSYYIYGGLVFVPMDRGTLETFGGGWAGSAPDEWIYEIMFRPLEDPLPQDRERIVLLRRMDHELNANMAFFRNQLVERVNGRTINNMQDLIEAIAENEGQYHVFEFAYFGIFSAMNREEADRANEEILEEYGISEDRRL